MVGGGGGTIAVIVIKESKEKVPKTVMSALITFGRDCSSMNNLFGFYWQHSFLM